MRIITDLSDLFRLARQRRRHRKALLDGTWDFVCRNPDGSVAWRDRVPNMWPTAALNDALQVYFNASTQRTAWFMGLVDNAGFTALAGSDTISSHGGWTENQGYTQATRPAVAFSPASGGSIASSSADNFSINTTVAIKGGFLCNDSTKGGTAGILGPTGLLSSVQNLVNGQTLSVSYNCPLVAT